MKKIIFILFFSIFLIVGCSGVKIEGEYSSGCEKCPPPWAPAWGCRAKKCKCYVYYYYPSVYVYFDVKRKVYFYLEGSEWKVSAQPPSVIVSIPHEYVVLELDTDKPYIYFKEHKKKYPPEKYKVKVKKD